MSKEEDIFYTTGEFAKKAGVTLRTLRFYDKIALLKPSNYSDAGHRLYSKQDFGRLQKILTLKFIGLSLEDIADIIKYDVEEKNFKKSLVIQKDIMETKIEHIRHVIKAIDEAINMIENNHVLNWDKFVNIINIINLDKKWMEQYDNASNLRARIKVHELYSSNKIGWMEWFFSKVNFPSNAKILEVGCGDGSLWKKNLDKVSETWDITLTDFSIGMVKDAKKNLGNARNRFKFKIVDVEQIPFEDESFDIVIANHMLYHVKDLKKALKEIKRVLKPGGYFYASTVGENHMKEMRQLIESLNLEGITAESWAYTENFLLENGLKKVLDIFNEAKIFKYEDSLLVTEAIPIIDYIFSMPGNKRSILTENKLNKAIEFINEEIVKSQGIYITKDTGYFEVKK